MTGGDTGWLTTYSMKILGKRSAVQKKINIMSEWYAKDINKKVKTGIKTKGMSGKPIVTEAPYGYVKDPDNKDFWIIDEEAAEVVRLIFRLFIGGKNRNQIAVYLT